LRAGSCASQTLVVTVLTKKGVEGGGYASRA
jgi:hypothetical protein